MVSGRNLTPTPLLAMGVGISALVALVLTVVQLPGWMYNFWPEWMTLVVIYWALIKPEQVGPFTAFVIGTLLEVLFVRKFGVLGLGLATVAFLVNSANQQLRVLSVWQQMFIVGTLVAVFKLLTGWLYGIVADYTITREFWYPILGSILIWPFVLILMEELRRRLRIR